MNPAVVKAKGESESPGVSYFQVAAAQLNALGEHDRHTPRSVCTRLITMTNWARDCPPPALFLWATVEETTHIRTLLAQLAASHPAEPATQTGATEVRISSLFRCFNRKLQNHTLHLKNSESLSYAAESSPC